MSCVSSVKHSILVNGSPTEFFHPKCGIRQGDPLSLYLFLLCMEAFSSLINVEVSKGTWKPFKINSCSFSHLLFVDDVLLFSAVNPSSLAAVKCCLDSFLACSGLMVNYDKSSLWFSNNVS